MDKNIMEVLNDISLKYPVGVVLNTRRSGWSLEIRHALHEVFYGYSIDRIKGGKERAMNPMVNCEDEEPAALEQLIRDGLKATEKYFAKG